MKLLLTMNIMTVLMALNAKKIYSIISSLVSYSIVINRKNSGTNRQLVNGICPVVNHPSPDRFLISFWNRPGL